LIKSLLPTKVSVAQQSNSITEYFARFFTATILEWKPLRIVVGAGNTQGLFEHQQWRSVFIKLWRTLSIQL